MILGISHLLPSHFIFLNNIIIYLRLFMMFFLLKMTVHCDRTIFRRFSDFRFSLVPTHADHTAIT